MSHINKYTYGPWAIITGASAGIGREIAEQLASAGIHLVLVARRLAKLEQAARDLENAHGIETRVVSADLSEPGIAERIMAQVEDLDIGLVVANAGLYSPGSFLTRDVDDFEEVIRFNAIVPMRLAYHVGNRLRKRGRGGIILVSSAGVMAPAPYLANYVASKSYVTSLGEALHHELKPQGIDVLVLEPGATRTHMATGMGVIDDDKLPMAWMEATDVAAEALKHLGRRPKIIAGRVNRVMAFVMGRVLPRRFAGWLMGKMMGRAINPKLLERGITAKNLNTSPVDSAAGQHLESPIPMQQSQG